MKNLETEIRNEIAVRKEKALEVEVLDNHENNNDKKEQEEEDTDKDIFIDEHSDEEGKVSTLSHDGKAMRGFEKSKYLYIFETNFTILIQILRNF